MNLKLLSSALGAASVLALAACSGETPADPAAHAVGHTEVAEVATATATDATATAGERVSGHEMHGYAAPSVDSLGGKFELTKVSDGKSFTEKDLLGTWSLVYMGYMECLEACPIAMVALPQAVDKLNAAGVSTKAVFVDINAPRLDDMSGAMGHGGEGGHNTPVGAPVSAHGGHGATTADKALTGPEVRRLALGKWGLQYDPDIIMLAGSRKQIINATTIFKTRAEATMMPTKEPIHHINHSTYIYVMDPKGAVVELLYHSDAPQMMADTVAALAKGVPTVPTAPVAAAPT